MPVIDPCGKPVGKAHAETGTAIRTGLVTYMGNERTPPQSFTSSHFDLKRKPCAEEFSQKSKKIDPRA